MLQTNLIFGIQKKIKEGRAVSGSMAPLEENTEVVATDEKNTEIILEGSLNSGIYQQTHQAQKKMETRSVLVTESFNLAKVQKKFDKDVVFFNYLYENFTPDVFKEDFEILLEGIFTDTIKVYQECDVTPRLLSPALDTNELTEAMVEDIYRNSLNETIKNKYTKPLLSGKINELYENEIKELTKKLIQEGQELDMGQVRVYLPFEESVNAFIESVVLPKTAQMRIESFMESVDADYTDFLEESVEDILTKLKQKIKLLASMIGPDMFNKAVETDGVEAPKLAGISIAIDKSFGGDGDDDCDDTDGCPAEALAADPEANAEMEAEIEAEEIDEPAGEAKTAEAEAEKSAAESSEEDDQPGAVELELPLQDGDVNPENGMVTNNSDVALSGEGIDDGVIDNPDAELPSEPDALDDEIEAAISSELNDEVNEETPEEDPEDNEEKEDVSEAKDK